MWGGGVWQLPEFLAGCAGSTGCFTLHIHTPGNVRSDQVLDGKLGTELRQAGQGRWSGIRRWASLEEIDTECEIGFMLSIFASVAAFDYFPVSPLVRSRPNVPAVFRVRAEYWFQ